MRYKFIENYRLNQITFDTSSLLNWLFLPGGPGMGSEYLINLCKGLCDDLPGSIFIGDFPGDGSNRNTNDIGYDQWKLGLLTVVKQLKPCILVTHSFSGMFALTIPELEELLAGLVIMNSAPSRYWIEELVDTAKKYNLPDLQDKISQFYRFPTDDNLRILFKASREYLFSPGEIQEGENILKTSSYNAVTRLWADKNFHPTYKYKWIPKDLPTLIIGSKGDRLIPIKLFLRQKKWIRRNIKTLSLQNAGHFSWLTCLESIKNELLILYRRLI